MPKNGILSGQLGMNIDFPTYHRLLVSKFPRTRSSLCGEVLVFSAPAKVRASAFNIAPISAPKNPKNPQKKKKALGKAPRFFVKGALSLVALLSFLSVFFYFSPQIYYAFFPVESIAIQPATAGSVLGGEFDSGPVKVQYIPEYNPDLPDGDWLVIPSIGVRTQLRKTPEPEEALAEGVWWVPDYGNPGSTELPMILAAHRFGWDWWWKDDYWRYNSFYLLPETKPGDMIEVISDHRKWVYEIYAGEEGDLISDYSADMILYTCKFLNSPVRHFRYARLINPNIDSQSSEVVLSPSTL